MKNFIAGILIFAMGVVTAWAFFLATAEVQEDRETALAYKIDNAKVGSYLRVNGVGLFKTSHHAGRVGE